MPGSAISAASGSHVSSTASRRVKNRQYYKIANHSHVDETLFGTPNRETQRQQMQQERRLNELTGGESSIEREANARSSKRKGKAGKETIQLVTKDLIRNLTVPQDDPSGKTCILYGTDLDRIKGNARIRTEEEERQKMEHLKEMRNKMMEDIQQRRDYLKGKELRRRSNEKLTDLEEEERQKSEYLREQAFERLQEQEDEVKKLNELILNAKCHAIRDAQVLEKGQIQKEMQQEEVRLDTMMELERRNAIKVDEEIEKKRKQERLIGAMKLVEQIEENEQLRLLELERKDQENRHLKTYLDSLCEEELKKLQQRRNEQERMRQELNDCNSDILRRKELAKEQERVIELKVLEFQKEKADREAALEADQERIRIDKEKEVARLRAQQERARDEQADRDALKAKRAMEQAERDWRRKEAEEARKKAEVADMLKRARAEQMDQKEHFLAVEAQRERAEFERVLKAQHDLVEKDRREEDERSRQRVDYAKEIRGQIRAREQERISERNAHFQEGIKLDEEAAERRDKLEIMKRKKLDELRAAGIHDRYLAQIERKINQPQHIAA